MDKTDFLRDRESGRDNETSWHSESSSVQAPERLEYPEIWEEDINLRHITDIEGLKLPKILKGTLDLANITHAPGLVLPEEIDGDFDMVRLISTEGITWPKRVTGRTYLGALPADERARLKKEHKGLNIGR